MAAVIFALIGAGAVGFMLVFLVALCKEARQKVRSDAVLLIRGDCRETELLPGTAAAQQRTIAPRNHKRSEPSSLNELFTKPLVKFYDRPYPMWKGTVGSIGRSAGK